MEGSSELNCSPCNICKNMEANKLLFYVFHVNQLLAIKVWGGPFRLSLSA